MSGARSGDRPRPTAPGPEDREPRWRGVPPWLQERLFLRRAIALYGPITDEVAAETVVILHSLDTTTEPVTLHLDAPEGDLAATLSLMDAIDMLGCPVHAFVAIQCGGAAVGLLAAARRRAAYPHARIRLAEPALVVHTGTAEEMAKVAGRHLQALEELATRIATTSGQRLSRVESDLGVGVTLSATEARTYGLIDAITTRDEADG